MRGVVDGGVHGVVEIQSADIPWHAVVRVLVRIRQYQAQHASHHCTPAVWVFLRGYATPWGTLPGNQYHPMQAHLCWGIH